MVKRKFVNDSKNRKQKTNSLSIGQDSADVIKLFLDLRSRLSFNQSCKLQYKSQNKDNDFVLLKSLFETGWFRHPTIPKTTIKNFPEVVKIMINIFCGNGVFTNIGSGERLKQGVDLVKPNYMCITAQIEEHSTMDELQFILGSEKKNEIFQFDFSCTYWEKLCLEWSDMEFMIDSISATFQGYQLITQGFSDPRGFADDSDGLAMDDNYLQWNIHNPLFSEAAFLEKYPKGCYPGVVIE
jgi:hypothetical protein